MQYARLGSTGLIVSKLSLGTMTFGHDPSVPSVYKVTQEGAQAMVKRALSASINFFDTADGYAGAQSEEILDRALGKRRQDAVVATKVGFRTGDPITQAGLSRRHIFFPASGVSSASTPTTLTFTSYTKKTHIRRLSKRLRQ